MQYLSKHAAAKKISVKQRIAGVGIAGAATIIGGSGHGRLGQGCLGLGRRRRVRVQRQLGTSTPATASTAACSSRRARGAASAARPTPRAPTSPRRAQQIAIAQRVLASQGPGAWPVCSVARRSDARQRRRDVEPDHGLAVDRRARRVTTKKVAQRQEVGHTKKTYAVAPTARNTAKGAKITVHSGDTLGKLAQRYHVAGGWKALWKANGARVTNPNLIFVGQTLRLP